MTFHLILEKEKGNNEIMVSNSKISIEKKNFFLGCFLFPGTELMDLVSFVTRT